MVCGGKQIFTLENEPYLGRESVFHFDKMIQDSMQMNALIAPWTRGRTLTPLQRAATEIIPHGFSIALGIRELIRQGYLLSAEILLRPLLERVAVVSYLCEVPDALPLWEAGWPHKSRPPLYKMLAVMKGGESTLDDEAAAREIAHHFNAVVHADPIGARRQVVKLENGQIGYTASMSLRDVEKCDDICFQSAMYLVILTARAIQVFPEVKIDFDAG